MKYADDDYELYTSADTGNEKYTNWFFFRGYNTRKAKKYKFTINNMSKSKSLFNSGGKILMYSQKKDKFYRSGEQIVFFCNFIRKKNNNNCYSMFFEIEFPEDCDTVYISLNYPYTYSRVNSLMTYLFTQTHNNLSIRRFSLTKTACNNDLEAMSIKVNSDKKKKAVIIGARVHPAETISSHVMEKLLLMLVDQ